MTPEEQLELEIWNNLSREEQAFCLAELEDRYRVAKNQSGIAFMEIIRYQQKFIDAIEAGEARLVKVDPDLEFLCDHGHWSDLCDDPGCIEKAHKAQVEEWGPCDDDA